MIFDVERIGSCGRCALVREQHNKRKDKMLILMYAKLDGQWFDMEWDGFTGEFVNGWDAAGEPAGIEIIDTANGNADLCNAAREMVFERCCASEVRAGLFHCRK